MKGSRNPNRTLKARRGPARPIQKENVYTQNNKIFHSAHTTFDINQSHLLCSICSWFPLLVVYRNFYFEMGVAIGAGVGGAGSERTGTALKGMRK